MPDSFPPERPGLLKRLWGGGPEKTKTFRLPVNAYGKLPIYKDFISSGLTEPAAREFRAWLDKGFSHRWATDEGCRDAEIPPYNFLVRLPDSRHPSSVAQRWLNPLSSHARNSRAAGSVSPDEMKSL